MSDLNEDEEGVWILIVIIVLLGFILVIPSLISYVGSFL